MSAELQIITSVEAGDRPEVEKRLNDGISVNAQDYDGTTLLQVAAAYGHEDIAQLLISKGADVDLPNNYGWTPLMHAAKYGHTSTILTLLKNKAKVNVANKLGLTPILAAAWSGQLSSVQILLEAGAVTDYGFALNVEKSDCDWTALMVSAFYGHDAILGFLLEKGVSVNVSSLITGFSPLMLAACSGHISIVKMLVKSGADFNRVDICGRTALHIAYVRNKHDVKAFLADVTQPDFTSEKTNETSILQAVRNGNNLQVKLILQEDSSCSNAVDSLDGYTPLMLAAMLGYLDIAHSLIQSGANLNAQDKTNGWTAIMHAVFYRQLSIVKYLISQGADINIKANNGYTALDLANYVDNSENAMVKALINGSTESRNDFLKPESICSTVMFPILSKGRKLSSKNKLSPKSNVRQRSVKDLFGSVTNHLQTLFPRTSSKYSESCNNSPVINVPEIELGENDVFKDGNSAVESPIPKAKLSLSALYSPKSHLLSCLRKHVAEPITPPLLNFSSQEDTKEKKLKEKLPYEGTPKGKTLQTPHLLKSYTKESILKKHDNDVSKNIYQKSHILLADESKVTKLTFQSPNNCKAVEKNMNKSPNDIKTLNNAGDLTKLLNKESLQKYVKLFREQEVDIEAFQYLTKEDLNEIGVRGTSTCETILEIVKELKQKYSSS